jgi:hypothetical protein
LIPATSLIRIVHWWSQGIWVVTIGPMEGLNKSSEM